MMKLTKAYAMRTRLKRFLEDCKGMIAAELALALPVLLLLTLGGAELSRYILLTQKVNRTAATMGDLISQAISLNEQSITDLYASVEKVMVPFSLEGNGRIIVSSVGPEANPPYASRVLWQRCSGTSPAPTSRVGAPGALADFSYMTTPFVVPPGANVIVAEIYYDYVPEIIGNVTGAHQMYDIVIYTPRIVPLTQIDAGGTVSNC